MSGGMVPVFKKYTTGSKGIWEKIRQLLVIAPERSSGNPIVSLYRVPAPGSHPAAKSYDDPYTVPAGDIAENTYFKRDHRRNYPRVSTFDQTKIAGLLEIGSAKEPRVLVGKAGEQQLSVYNKPEEPVYLSTQLKKITDDVINGQILGKHGEPVLAPSFNKGMQWNIIKDNGVYGVGEYPCRLFNYAAVEGTTAVPPTAASTAQ
ncbi:hypothetical protein BON22_1485 [Cyberlindnera fabianii]|uniref:NADH-ubiquinone oxidoreductase 21.3 kDa subunit n=1 Tax=Cyberlindnera fabianii TaxID=36022 RepID=A0A1V2L9D1_CYBFA|nr:hypothetical protein BON22_1485 [Cyberlindnera fabianii]